MEYLVYILYSHELDRYYIGHTAAPIAERLKRHLSNHSGYTSKTKDWVLIYTEGYHSKKEAYARELDIKGKKSRKYIENFISSAG
ncbi:MAG: GIY-YIG nuclease family protein [Aequorivita sp.]|nr:GIY-YIG nuclease family protein [Aequorivita sp.]